MKRKGDRPQLETGHFLDRRSSICLSKSDKRHPSRTYNEEGGRCRRTAPMKVKPYVGKWWK